MDRSHSMIWTMWEPGIYIVFHWGEIKHAIPRVGQGMFRFSYAETLVLGGNADRVLEEDPMPGIAPVGNRALYYTLSLC